MYVVEFRKAFPCAPLRTMVPSEKYSDALQTAVLPFAKWMWLVGSDRMDCADSATEFEIGKLFDHYWVETDEPTYLEVFRFRATTMMWWLISNIS